MFFSKSKSKKKAKTYIDYTFVDELKGQPISNSLEENKKKLKYLFNDCSDVSISEFQIKNGQKALSIIISGMTNPELVNQAMKAMMNTENDASGIDDLRNVVLPFAQVVEDQNLGDFLMHILSGNLGILVDNESTGLAIGITGFEMRSISEPETESSIRGPREGFIENIRINTSMIRRKIKSPHLKTKPYRLGRVTGTDLAVVYLDNLIDPNLLKELDRRLNMIDIDGILESGYIEELIQDNIYSPFPQFKFSERPDTVAAALLQGKFAIIVDGTPDVLIAPTVFINLMQASEDYYERYMIATLIRWLRYLFLFLALTTPAFYIAFSTYHQDIIPTTLLLSIVAAHEAIPFPSIIEALIMEVTFEALREASVRLPKTIGQAVSILGALVVGQAAVEAGIVSAPMVIVVSVTGIASFTIPTFNAGIAIRLLRFPIMFAASLFGIFGIFMSLLLLLGHLANLKSFGVPYLAPLAPLRLGDLKDSVVAAPWPFMKNRPEYVTLQNQKRMGNELRQNVEKNGGLKNNESEEVSDPGE
ncbi:spore germination protein [Chengkuizengella axinellae]|uniref:Spore germination protein n=1 Tax=Chengkuizengella axinellae TaxID=3064388 RepID=A0ABT9J513_9BACL|nr:spore germination protein [Chengkuizengella sp. 2205SS18-9]MDP5276663.1 spore germination protein [Chengkuizengella sp. 2205SS18-9]